MKRIYLLLTMAAIVAVSVSAVMADTATNSVESSSFAVNGIYDGTYTGTCDNVDMNGDTDIDPVSGVNFEVNESGEIYKFTGVVEIAVWKDGFYIEHLIDFDNFTFTVDEDGCIKSSTCGGHIYIYVDYIPVGDYDFDVDDFTGCFYDDTLDFHIHCIIPSFYNFYAAFHFNGRR